MVFVSLAYALFLITALILYWSQPSLQFRLWVILAVSLIFYTALPSPDLPTEQPFTSIISAQVAYLPLLLILTLLNFQLGKAMGENTGLGLIPNSRFNQGFGEKTRLFWDQRRRKILIIGIFLNVFLLLAFKYIPFGLNAISGLYGQITGTNLSWLENSANWVDQRLIPPLGISFFCFESIAYLIDVYRGAPAAYQLLDFLSYKWFFPKLISGPITRYHFFSSQFKSLQFPNLSQITEGLWLIACGAFKKALLADRLGIFVTLCFGNAERAGSTDLWLAIVAYGLQLYLDFSGYVDIARGSAILLGFNLPENFNFPYLTTNIAVFWRRWHITLGDWLRNYLYFPLGGSRQGLTRTCLNLLIVMFIAGIWHGAAWGFIVWGLLQGAGLVCHRLTEALSQRVEALKVWWDSWLGILVAWGLTQGLVFLSWVYFRLPDLKQSNLVMSRLWGYPADAQFISKIYLEGLQSDRPQQILLVTLIFIAMSLIYAIQRGLKLQLNWTMKLLLIPLSLYLVWIFAPTEGLPYIYFDF